MTGNDKHLLGRVCSVVARTFNVQAAEVTADSGPANLTAWDSLGHLTLMMEIEKEFRVRFATEQIAKPRSVRDICLLLRSVLPNG